MSQNIKSTKYVAYYIDHNQKHQMTFSEVEITELVSYVQNVICTLDIPVMVKRETQTYNIHKPSDVAKIQSGTRTRKIEAWSKVPNGPVYTGFFDWLGYPLRKQNSR